MRSVSAPLPAPLLAAFEQRFRTPVIEIYGMTETAGVITSNPLPDGMRKPGSVGIAAGPEVAVVDEAGRAREPMCIGEVVVRGDNVMRGYADAEARPRPPPSSARGSAPGTKGTSIATVSCS